MLAAVVLATVVRAAPPPPTLCIDDVCREAAATISPAIVARPFVWISADGTRVIADVVAANTNVVPLEGERVAHRLTVAASDASRDFVPELALRCGARTWTWSFARMPRQMFALAHPAGDCTLSVRATGYRAVERALTAGVIYLQRLPVLSGIVTDARTAASIEGARLLLPEGNVLATTDARGHFRAIVDGPWPARIRAEAAGRAPRTIDLPKVVADAELAIAMSAGGSVHLTLAPPLGGEAVRWELRDVDDEKVKTGELAAGVTEVTIDGVDPGAYRVIVAGEGALQRIAIPVRVSEEHVAEPVARIEPLRLDLEVTRGNAPFANAEIEMIFRDGAAAWRANVTADASGMAAEEIWQRGTYIGSVGLWQDERRVSTAEDEHVMWKLAVPDRVVRGRVVDAATDRTIADANVFLELRSGERQSTMRTRADTSGAYEFKLVPSGAYSLRTRPPGYEELRTPLADLGEDTTIEVRDPRVAAVSGHALHVRNVAGAPIGGASVYIVSRGVRFAGLTNDDGRMTLPLSFDEAGEVYVLPRSGSFASVRFASMADEGLQELAVSVPDGVASLEMRTVSDEGEPIAKVAFVLRVNGAVLPADIVAAMNREQGLPLWSDDDGRLLFARMPAGRYEIWPLTSPADRLAASSASPPPAPVSVTLTAGRQEAKLTFKAR